MQSINSLPDGRITEAGEISKTFSVQGISTFQEACRKVRKMPYGYNSDRDNLFILFAEGKGTCTSKHAVIATLARELHLPVEKHIGIYAMTEALVTGTQAILDRYELPCLPMVHCFLAAGPNCVDLTEGNRNGKNGPINDFLFTAPVEPNISAKDEYRLYRQALTEKILLRPEFQGKTVSTVLKAREEGLALLKDNIQD